MTCRNRLAMIAGLRGERGPPDTSHPAPAGADDRARRARHHRRDREGGGAAAGAPGAAHRAAVLRPGPEVMRNQLARLVELSTRPRILIHILPGKLGANAGLGGAINLAATGDRAEE